jgi:pimeloyl-ACP methyl ester carboxylesterase
MPYLERGGAQLYYEDVGQGEAILTTHGLSENTAYWSLPGITDALAERFRVVSMDMRGHGRSITGDPPGFDAGTMADDIGALADALGLARFHLLSHATGGMVALRYARAHGDRLLSLLLTDTGSETAFTPDAAVMAQIRDGLARHFENRDWPAILASHRKNPAPFMTRLDHAARPRQAWAMIDAVMRAGDPNTLARFCRSFYVDPDAHVDELRMITCPTLVLLGEHDQAFLGPSALLAAEIPNAVHVVMPGLGHMTAIEDPGALLRELFGFLESRGDHAHHRS